MIALSRCRIGKPFARFSSNSVFREIEIMDQNNNFTKPVSAPIPGPVPNNSTPAAGWQPQPGIGSSAAGPQPQQPYGIPAGLQQSYGTPGGSQQLPPQNAAVSARRRFTASFREKLTAFLTFIPAYFYAKMTCEGLFWWIQADLRYPDLAWRIDFAVFLLSVIALTVFIFFKEKHRFESMVWFACLLSCGISVVFSLGNVWEDYQKLLFAHGFLLYWILSFSDRLSEGRSGRLLILDAANVLFIVPFKRYFYRLRTIVAAFRDGFTDRERKHQGAVLWALLSVLAAAILLPLSVSLLKVADRNFANLLRDFSALFDANWGRYIAYFFLSLPAAAFIYGVLGGFFREEKPRIQSRGSSFLHGIQKLRKTPPAVWAVLLMIFTAVYTVFFIVQRQSLFDAFRGICPEDPRTYVRESFFALLKVSLINFVLLCVTHNSARDLERKNVLLTVMKVLLLVCNMLFCVIALSRIVLYIKTWDFTPLRLQSGWLVVTLFSGCVAAVIAVISGKRPMRAWMVLSSVTLSALCFF